MPDLDITSTGGKVDKRYGRGGNNPYAEKANMFDIATMKARLTVISASRYPAAKLASMTKNDLEYALRTEADSAGI